MDKAELLRKSIALEEEQEHFHYEMKQINTLLDLSEQEEGYRYRNLDELYQHVASPKTRQWIEERQSYLHQSQKQRREFKALMEESFKKKQIEWNDREDEIAELQRKIAEKEEE